MDGAKEASDVRDAAGGASGSASMDDSGKTGGTTAVPEAVTKVQAELEAGAHEGGATGVEGTILAEAAEGVGAAAAVEKDGGAPTQDELSRARAEMAEQSLKVENGLRGGAWEGHCIVQGERIGLAMDLQFQPNEEHTSTTVSGGGEDGQGAFDVRGTTMPNGKVRLEKEWRETGHTVTFEGASFSGKIAGHWKEGELSGAFVLVHQSPGV